MPTKKKSDGAQQAKQAKAQSTPETLTSLPSPRPAASRKPKAAPQPEAAPVKAARTARPGAAATKRPAARETQGATAEPTPAPVKAATRGRKAVQAAPETPAAVQERAAVPVAEPVKRGGRGKKAPAPAPAEDTSAVTEPAAIPETPAGPAARKPRSGRKVAATPVAQVNVPNPRPAEQPVTVTDESPAVAQEAAIRPAATRRTRRAGKDVNSTPPADPAPLILEVPKRRGRGKRAGTLEGALAEVEVLAGVEAVPVVTPAEADERAPAGVQVVTRAHVRPVVDLPSADDAQPDLPAASQPESPPRSSRRKAKAAPVTEPDVDAGPNPDDTTEGREDEGELDGSETDERLARDLVMAQLRKLGRPVHVRDLERTFTRQMLDRLGGWRDLSRLLEDLADSGDVVRTRKKTYGLPEAMSLVRGRFQASAAGFGFVVPDSGGEDYYIPAEQTLEAWNGDIVLVRMEGRGDTGNRAGPRRGQKGDGSPRASVVRIVQRAYRQLVGTLEFHHGHPILKPDDHRARHRILVLPEGLEGLEAGARVVTELYWPENTGEDEVFGQVTRTLGAEDDPATETEAVIVKFGLRGDFPGEVLAQANAIPAQIPAEALVGRLDLRNFNIFTVDGRDAKDFDDAIHIQPTPAGTFVVGVHIADVSHYVQEGTPLDEEAYARATSVYLPGRVLPMLPEHLSNGVCSLVPFEDRLTMTALVELSAEGEILDVKLTPSVINSKARLTYDEVQAYSEATATLPEHARQLEGDLHLLLKITSKLRQKRLREGSLDFKLREVKVDVGPDGRMELIPIREETARGMIEDLMLLANKVVARFLIEREVPALFRIHEEPTLQRFQDVTAAIGRLGFAFPGGEPTPQAYQAVLKQVRGTNRESVVNTLLLRSMQQAKYAGENLGHFGLAFDEYLHFTSPIRRYPDLLVHRVLRGVLSGELRAAGREVAQLRGRLPAMGDHTSDRERTASEAERDLTKYYQCKWAQEHTGESFQGNVSGVVASGLYVALENGVEGKLHISNLDDDYYVFLEDAQMLRGRSRGRSFRLGDPVSITIQTVKPLARQIDLTLADPSNPEYKPGVIPQENTMDSPVKVRARRREDREQEKQERLKAVPVSEPKKFTLDDPEPVHSSSALAPARTGSRGRGGPQGGRGNAGGARGTRTFGGVPMDSAPRDGGREANGRAGRGNEGGRGPRRVITLERPRNEHLRPVNITVQRMYFGDWTLDNMPPEEPQGRRDGGGRPDRAASERGGRGYSRGGNDRSATPRANGRSPQGQAGGAKPAAAPTPATPAAGGDEASKRRRRRRGRRSGNGNASE